MQEGDNVWFGIPHIMTLMFFALLGFLLIFISRRYLDRRQRDLAGVVLGILMIVVELGDLSFRLLYLGQPVSDNLPLHLCGPIYYMVAVMLITKNRTLYDLTYFLGLAGAANSVLTPGEIFPFPHLLNITFFFTHGMIIIGILWVTICMKGYKPTWKAFFKTFIFLNALALAVTPVNILLNTNYLFLCHKPPGGTMMDLLGPWPIYLVFVELLGLFLCLIAFSPFIIMDIIRWKRRERNMDPK